MAIDVTAVKTQITRIKTNIDDAFDEAAAKGATMPTVRNSDNLPATIASIPSGPPEPEEWQPRSDWYNIQRIVDDDEEEYTGKVGVLYRRVDNYDTTLIPVSTVGAVKAKTSDGYTYTTDTQHTWDTTQDKPDNVSSNYYVIYYFGERV